MCDSFTPIEAVLTRLAHKASKGVPARRPDAQRAALRSKVLKVPTKSGVKMACKGGVESYEHSFLLYKHSRVPVDL